MLGNHHAVFGGAVFLAATSATHAVVPMSGQQMLVGAVVAMGAALVPDLDEPGSSASRSFGFVGRHGARLVSLLAGGHRGRTHTLPVVAVGLVAVYLATASTLAVSVLLGLLVMVGLDVLHSVKEGVEWLVGLVVALLASQLVSPGDAWPVLAVGCGWLSHMAGDTLTPHGVPWLWPLRPLDDTVSVGLFRSGSPVEPVVVAVLVGGLVFWAMVNGGLPGVA